MAKKNKKVHIICLVLCLVFVAAAVWLLGKLMQPKYMSGVLEGAMTAEYYNETQPHDVIFIGDCEVYENFYPSRCGKTTASRVTSEALPSSSSGSRTICLRRRLRRKTRRSWCTMYRP